MNNITSFGIAPHEYEGTLIVQAIKDIDINGLVVPTGYVNLSQMCLVKKKRLNDYLSNKSVLSYFVALQEVETESQSGATFSAPLNQALSSNAKSFGIASGLLIQTKDAIGGDGAIFGHYEIAIDVAQWMDARFRVWANKTLRLVLTQDFIPLTEAARLAEQKLQEYRATLFGGGNINNAEYIALCQECREDNRNLRLG